MDSENLYFRPWLLLIAILLTGCNNPVSNKETIDVSTYSIRAGTSSYNAYARVSAYKEDLATTYFYEVFAGYTGCSLTLEKDQVVYIRVKELYGYNSRNYGIRMYSPIDLVSLEEAESSLEVVIH